MENQTPGVQQILATNIRNARKKLGYSQQALAERASISPGHMNDLEQGRKWVSADTLDRIASALALQPYALLLPSESPELESFDVLTTYTTALRERIDAVLNNTLRETLASRDTP